MLKLITSIIFLVFSEFFVSGCLITNCPKGGKRSEFRLNADAISSCVSCGPGQAGQCFGPHICCGPFGCLMGTPDTIRCQRWDNEHEPCTAGSATCRKNTGRCAFDGICCNQDSCHIDKTCTSDGKLRIFPEASQDLYSLINYQAQLTGDK